MGKIRFGVLSTAKIGVQDVIPALQQSEDCTVSAISSRSYEKAKGIADKLDIEKAYGSYEELLEDSDIDAVYNPLPNHMHIPWSKKALKAGKHVLCEKPLGMSQKEVIDLIHFAEKFPELKVMEAFMYRFHPQWQKTKELVQGETIGKLTTIQSMFSYFKTDPDNIRNKPEMGGGGMMDIGCYCLSLARFLFDKEPNRILGWVEEDPDLQIDRLASGILEFENGTSTFTCSTQMAADQRVTVYGTDGKITIEIPFNPPADQTTAIWLEKNGNNQKITFEPCNQYTLQGEAFVRAILENKSVPTPLTDTLHNMQAIEAVFESSRKKGWIEM